MAPFAFQRMSAGKSVINMVRSELDRGLWSNELIARSSVPPRPPKPPDEPPFPKPDPEPPYPEPNPTDPELPRPIHLEYRPKVAPPWKFTGSRRLSPVKTK
jgi:hypothetical protein